jgi:SAM-dependent methyltransferase
MHEYFRRREPSKVPDYEEAYWGTIVDPDGKVRDRLAEREQHLDDIRQELAFLNSLPPGRIVDVGCGLGFLLSGLKPGWDRHGVEVSRYAAEHAQQYGRIFVGSLEQAHYPAAHFDVVVLHHVIEHLEDPIACILEIHRVLVSGGVLLLGTPDFDSGCARRFGENYRLLHDPTHISLFTNDSMHRFLRDHGFVIERVEYPFFETRHFTAENLMRLFDTSKISPPFYGNFMTFYCRKP